MEFSLSDITCNNEEAEGFYPEIMVKCPMCGCTETHVSNTQESPARVFMSCDNGHKWRIAFHEFEGWTTFKVDAL